MIDDRRAESKAEAPTPSPERSAMMRSVKASGTTPELLIRRTLHALGRRFRVCDRKFPGKPDLRFPSSRKIILVHGCFWHRHDCKAGKAIPKTNRSFRIRKFERNVERDVENVEELGKLGYDVLVAWEGRTKGRNAKELIGEIPRFLDGAAPDDETMAKIDEALTKAQTKRK
jgi:DNA mismatch endonuclease (patch repair protein)